MSILGKSGGQDSQVGGFSSFDSSSLRKVYIARGGRCPQMLECTFNFPFRNTVKRGGHIKIATTMKGQYSNFSFMPGFLQRRYEILPISV